jgi:hypothetical protein
VRYRIVNPWDSKGCWYVAENVVDGYPLVTEDNWAGGVQADSIHVSRVDIPFPFAPVVTNSAENAYWQVLAKAGAVIPKRDAVDARIVDEVRTGTVTYGGVWGAKSGIIDSQSEVGGWPVIHSEPASEDNDHDGMPDGWEQIHGLDPSDPSDRNGDSNGDGYTNLEDYINSLCVQDDPDGNSAGQ